MIGPRTFSHDATSTRAAIGWNRIVSATPTPDSSAEAEKLTRRVLSLPAGTTVGSSDVSVICQMIRLALERSEGLKARVK
jgi:hypothetical protein